MLGLVKVEPRKTWNEVIRSDLKERKVSRDLAKDRCLEVFHKKPTNPYASMENILK